MNTSLGETEPSRAIRFVGGNPIPTAGQRLQGALDWNRARGTPLRIVPRSQVAE